MVEATPEEFGRAVLGPVVAEFCLRLMSLASLIEVPEGTAMLFCARGGLRLREAYLRFGDAVARPAPTATVPFMTSRLTSIRPALVPALTGTSARFGPAASTAIQRELSHLPAREAAQALSGVDMDVDIPRGEEPADAASVLAVLTHPDAAPAREELLVQAERFTRHVRESLGGAQHALLVDTGLYGTTGLLLAEGFPELRVSAALIAHQRAPGMDLSRVPTYGLIEHSDGYAPWRARSSLLRYWHFVEWLFEPALPSVRRFDERDGAVVSNLEQVDGWSEKVLPLEGEAFHGVLRYMQEDVAAGGEAKVLADAPGAWKRLRRAIVWPTADDATALAVGTRSHDFGRTETWTTEPWKGPLASLRGSTMWREGTIARSGTPLRAPLLATIEGAYLARTTYRTARRAIAGGRA